MPHDPQHQALIDLLKSAGDDVHEGQPEQVAGRWIEYGFEDPEEVGRWLAEGVTDPEDARRRAGEAAPGERHEDPTTDVRDVARGTTGSRSRVGDQPEREPQGSGGAL